jgi:hypothetical protein
MRMGKTKKNLTLDPAILAKAEELRVSRLFPNLTQLIERLIVEEWERRNGPVQVGKYPKHREQVSVVEDRVHRRTKGDK